MAGHGSPHLVADATGLHVAIVASSWHDLVMEGLVDGATRALREAGCEDIARVRVPGSLRVLRRARGWRTRTTRWSRSASSSGAGRRTSSTCARARPWA